MAGLVIGGCRDPRADGEAWEPDGTSTVGTSVGLGSSSVAGSTSSASEPGLDTGALDSSSGEGADESSSGGEPPYDCTPWPTPWIGAPCMADADCGYDGGICLLEDEGFPCGTCSQACEQYCPDLDGTPSTFCVDGMDVGIDPTGYCLSQCDPALLPGDGCRDGYDCTVLPRFMDVGTTTGVCVPEGQWEPMTECQQELLDRGVTFVPTTHEVEHPDGHPELDCTVDDPVLLYSPVLGVTLRRAGGQENPVLVTCDTAHAIADSAEIAALMEPVGATEIQRYSTYSCRVVAGTDSLSNHANGRAIDLTGFVLDDGSFITVFDHWEDGVAMPLTPEGQWLRTYTDALWETETWNTILTPEYSAGHDDHFHVDLSPGVPFYE